MTQDWSRLLSPGLSPVERLIRWMCIRLTPRCLWLALAGLVLVAQAPAHAAAIKTVEVALISLQDDARYQPRRLEHHYIGHPAGRLLTAAQLASQDTALALNAEGLRIAIQDVTLPHAQALPASLQRLIDTGVRYWVLDLPAPLVSASAKAAGQHALVFNASARDDVLRAQQCASNLFHVMPSDAMRSDALAQYLAERNWRKALVLSGESSADQALAMAWQRAAKRYGIKTTATKAFKLSGNPAERDMANTRLLTKDRDPDVVAVWDADGEFARTLPYATQWPRPVVGSNGLVTLAWHSHWERNGGPQLSRRFRQMAQRDMVSQDWAAWLSVKTVAALLSKTGLSSVQEQAMALRTRIYVDGYKGPRLSYRAWDGQLRQPLFVAHADGVVAVAPSDGVLHPTETMDTLGLDQPESTCKLQP